MALFNSGELLACAGDGWWVSLPPARQVTDTVAVHEFRSTTSIALHIHNKESSCVYRHR